MVKGIITSAIKKVTLELIYQVVDERTGEILTKIDEIKKKQEDDFRYLIQKIDTDVGQVNQRIDSLAQRMDNLAQKIDTEIRQVNQRIDSLAQRMDTVIQMLMSIHK